VIRVVRARSARSRDYLKNSCVLASPEFDAGNERRAESLLMAASRGKPSSVIDACVIYFGDNLDQLRKFAGCVRRL